MASEFDYIIVGSGAGGAPLARRLAEASREQGHPLHGKRILVLEAGPNHLAKRDDGEPVNAEAREVSQVPGFHALSTEHPDLSWEFFVKHYSNPPAGIDPKCYPKEGKQPPPEGIFYPRASGVGGCTVHNAMITIAGPDSDWEDLADFIGDDSWRGAAMRAYFQRLERNEYQRPPRRGPISWWRDFRDSIKWLFGFDPDRSRGKHGFSGWLRTSFTDLTIGIGDKQLTKMLAAALWEARRSGLGRGWTLVRRFLKGEAFTALDPNHAKTQAESPEGVCLVPLAVCGTATPIAGSPGSPSVSRGHRSSPREALLDMAAVNPNLEIWTDVLVTRVLFDDSAESRAIGVEFQRGRNLYNAVPQEHRSAADGAKGEVFVRAGGEIILSGGAFNTPQLLMLSGIGDQTHLQQIGGADGCVMRGRDGSLLRDEHGRARRIHRPGVGLNLQDRYEVTLISEMQKPFTLLDDATFALPDASKPADRHLKEWRAEGRGLYTSNGAVLGIFKRSNPDLEQPDLFIFGIPLPFRGYDVGYSRVGHVHDNFTWAILKGHTRNTDGTVRLRSSNPRDVPDINFHYFNETTLEGRSDQDPDLTALVEGVKFVRRITSRVEKWFRLPITIRPVVKREIHPGTGLVPDGNEAAMRSWIRRDAWGHHACGTCRMGPDGDDYAVLDSRFSVRGVKGLRVVDASIFPKIPGYFVVTNIYMASEKAADVIAEDAGRMATAYSPYPQELREHEARVIAQRRRAVHGDAAVDPINGSVWRDDLTGVALSGGGVRSATFNLGVLQAFARHKWLRRIDILSTVSGGGYIGAFLGRWFDRLRPHSEWGGAHRPAHDVAGRIERELTDPSSPALRWLRRHGNYLAPTGNGDFQVNAATFIRNVLSVHFVIAAAVFFLLGLVNVIRYFGLDPAAAGSALLFGMDSTSLPVGWLLSRALGVFYSPWFFIFELVLLLLVVPRMAAYWIVSQDRHQHFSGPALTALLLLVAALLVAGLSGAAQPPLIFVALALLLSFWQVERAWHRGRTRELAIGRGNVETQRLRTRNYLTYDLGLALSVAAGALGFAIVDAIGHSLQQWADGNRRYGEAFLALSGTVALLAPLARGLANRLARERSGPPSTARRLAREELTAGLMAAVLVIAPSVLVSFAAHAAYDGGSAKTRGLLLTALAFLLTLIFAHRKAVVFVNRSSLAQSYAARLARAYLGATNPVRFRPEGANVREVVAGDDIATLPDYQPYVMGGPLHILNMTVNQTVDFSSQRGNRDRKGENVAVSSLGMSVGRHAHARWAEARMPPGTRRKYGTRLVQVGHLAGTDHPLLDENGEPAPRVEMLSLRQWMAISGAAVTPGRGRTTRLGTALLFGLANLRTGHWWNCGVRATERDGFPELTFLGRAAHVLRGFFATQALLLSEWTARFPGPWDRYWYLSDGGFFEGLGAYELIRRRVPRIIVCDASADPDYDMGSMANLMRKVRIDFAASIEPFPHDDVPASVASSIGSLEDLMPMRDEGGNIIAPSRKHAALFWVNYTDGTRSLLLYVKASLTGDESADVQQYHRSHQEFPHEGTIDQFFDEEQWESYRCLGEHVLSPLAGDWFWQIPLTRSRA